MPGRQCRRLRTATTASSCLVSLQYTRDELRDYNRAPWSRGSAAEKYHEIQSLMNGRRFEDIPSNDPMMLWTLQAGMHLDAGIGCAGATQESTFGADVV